MNKHLNNVIQGSLYGLIAWLAYETVEVFLACILPMIMRGRIVSAADWRMLGLLFAAYPVIGLLLGGLAALSVGLIRPAMDKFLYRASASLTLVLFGIAHLIADTWLTGSELIAMCVGVVVAIALVAAMVSDGWRRRAGFLSSPWTVSLLLLVAPCTEELGLSSVAARTALSLTVVVAVVIAGGLLYGRFPRRGLAWSLPASVAVLLLSFGAVWLLSIRHGAFSAEAASRSPQRKPNVLLIVMDTVRADHLSLYGYGRDTTPDLRKLAQAATVYTRATAASDMTLPSHASMFTGVYPSWHQAVTDPLRWPRGRPLDDKRTTLAQTLRGKGYFTAAVVANRVFLDPRYQLNRGFAVYEDPAPLVVTDWLRNFYLRDAIERLLPRVRESQQPCVAAGYIDRSALAALSHETDKPFFLFLNYMDAHDPYLPPAPFDTLFPGRNGAFMAGWLRQVTFDFEFHGRPLPDAVRRHLISQYDGSIAYMDSEIARLMAELKRRGLYDNTMIVITSDHGEALGEHGRLRHWESSVYQDQVYVPLLIKYPGQKEGQTSDELVSHVDLMPTILEQLGYPSPSGLQGRSLLHEAQPNHVVYSEAYSGVTTAAPLPARFKGVKRAAFLGQLKLIVSTVGPAELYDLSTDPHELQELNTIKVPAYGALRLQLASWMKSMPGHVHDVKREVTGNLESLRSLGYVQ